MKMIYWLAIFIVLLVIEIIIMGLTTIWFAGGAQMALAAGLLGFGNTVQIVVFVVVSALLLILTRPLAVKYFNQERLKTNAESLIGQRALVIEDIDTLEARGRVEIRGQEWAAKTDEPDGKLAKNTVVVVNGIQGVKLIVRAREEREC